MPRPKPPELGVILGVIKAKPNWAALKWAGLDNASTRRLPMKAGRDGERPALIKQGNVFGGYIMPD